MRWILPNRPVHHRPVRRRVQPPWISGLLIMQPVISVRIQTNTSLPNSKYSADEYLRLTVADTNPTLPELSLGFRTVHKPSDEWRPRYVGQLQPRPRRSATEQCRFVSGMTEQNPEHPTPDCPSDCVPTVWHSVHSHRR